jgi:hypothetical protein
VPPNVTYTAALGVRRETVLTLAVAQIGLGYEGAADVVRVPIKKKADRPKLDYDQHTCNKLLRGLRVVSEWENSLLTATFKILRRVSLDLWRMERSPRPRSSYLTTSTTGPCRHHTM